MNSYIVTFRRFACKDALVVYALDFDSAVLNFRDIIKAGVVEIIKVEKV